MRKIINIVTIVVISIILSSCARGCQSFDRDFDISNHKIIISQYSGGKLIGQWKIDGIVNNSDKSDGYYFYYNGRLIEISGDITLEYLN